jgi:hypothetical protein
MHDFYVERLETVAADLRWLAEPLMFFGAGVLPLYLDRPGTDHDLRPTEDVDAMVHVVGPSNGRFTIAITIVEEELRRRGWTPDSRSHRKNMYAYLSPHGVAVDFVFDSQCEPTDWAVVAQDSTVERSLPSGQMVRVPTPGMYLVCKADASRNPKRWEGVYESHDIEDITLLMARCSCLSSSISELPNPARAYLREWAMDLAKGGTGYAKNAYALLEANWPRGADVAVLDSLIEQMVDGNE